MMAATTRLFDWMSAHRQSAVSLALVGLSMGQVGLLAVRGGPLNSRWEYLGLEAALAGIGVLCLTAALAPRLREALGRAVAELGGALRRWAWLAWLGVLLAFPILALGGWGRFLEPLWVRATALWLLGLLASTVLGPAWPGLSPAARLAVTLLAGGAIHQAATQIPGLFDYPLTLGWSEASRYYYASLFLAERVYGARAPLSVLHPSRYLLQALPFLIAGLPIWLHRLWQSFLWLGLPLLTAGLLALRLHLEERWQRAGLALWAFLFIFQGPILYHLLLTAVPVLWGLRPGRFGRSLLLVLAGSIWAGLSRINWFAVPGFLAAALYLLESARGDQPRARYWARPLIWIVLGGLTAVATNALYVPLSGNQASDFGSSFTSDLLWYRLLPNRTFAPGILLAAALASLPTAWVFLKAWSERAVDRDPARWLPAAGILALFLVGGVVVSVKIGGGSNLHNLDAYLLLIMVLVSHVGSGRAAGMRWAGLRRVGWGGGLLLVAVPLLFNLKYGTPASRPDPALGQEVLSEIRRQIAGLGPDPQVLLISERQLLTFGELEGVELIPPYEKVFLMEMAMSGNRSYLELFRAALQEQRFDLIISDPLKVQFQGRTRAFGEENDAWVNQVSLPVLCFYEPVWTSDRAAVQILRPRAHAPLCPDLPLGG
jgi:hypothetical protein